MNPPFHTSSALTWKLFVVKEIGGRNVLRRQLVVVIIMMSMVTINVVDRPVAAVTPAVAGAHRNGGRFSHGGGRHLLLLLLPDSWRPCPAPGNGPIASRTAAACDRLQWIALVDARRPLLPALIEHLAHFAGAEHQATLVLIVVRIDGGQTATDRRRLRNMRHRWWW